MKLLDYLILEPSILLHTLRREFGGEITEHPGGLYSYYLNRGGKVLGVAHCDTVANGMLPMPKRGNGTISTIALDDRLGIYALFCGSIRGNYDILITDGEESGRSTAEYFEPSPGTVYNWMFEVDRRGTDAVCYQYTDFEKTVSQWFPIGYGSFSDIAALEHLGIMGVNIGIGYYQEHSKDCFAVWDHFNSQLQKLSEMISAIGNVPQIFQDSVFSEYVSFADDDDETLKGLPAWRVTTQFYDSLESETTIIYATDEDRACEEIYSIDPSAEIISVQEL